jgi:hypothetical protein
MELAIMIVFGAALLLLVGGSPVPAIRERLRRRRLEPGKSSTEDRI